VTAALARHYGLVDDAAVARGPEPDGAPAGARWVGYGSTGRKGILAHGSFLTAGAKFAGDTSPVARGLLIRERLMCQDIPPPPPGVNSDEPPPAGEDAKCKEDRYHFHKEGGCGKCHRHIDPLGFGLERYDHQGRYRTVEAGKPACAISGVGEMTGVGEFSGPAGLADAMLKSGRVGPCLVTQLYRYALGRYKLDDADTAAVSEVVAGLGGAEADFTFQDALLAIASAEAFRHRRETSEVER
jgi:hypothetical protein